MIDNFQSAMKFNSQEFSVIFMDIIFVHLQYHQILVWSQAKSFHRLLHPTKHSNLNKLQIWRNRQIVSKFQKKLTTNLVLSSRMEYSFSTQYCPLEAPRSKSFRCNGILNRKGAILVENLTFFLNFSFSTFCFDEKTSFVLKN